LIALFKTTTFPKVGLAKMVQASADINVPVQQLSDHHERQK
jgi:hypothetical protein